MRGYQEHYRPLTNQKVSVGATSAAVSNAFGAHVQVVRIISTVAAYVKFGATPTATNSDMLIAANVPELFTVSPGAKVALLRVSGDGEAHVTEMTQ